MATWTVPDLPPLAAKLLAEAIDRGLDHEMQENLSDEELEELHGAYEAQVWLDRVRSLRGGP